MSPKKTLQVVQTKAKTGFVFSVLVGLVSFVGVGFVFAGLLVNELRTLDRIDNSVASCATFSVSSGALGSRVDTELALYTASTDLVKAIAAKQTGQTLASLANKQKKLLIDMLQIDPVTAKNYFLSDADKLYLSKNTKNCVPSEISQSGELLMSIHEEPVDRAFVQLNTSDKTYYVAMTDTSVLDTKRTAAQLRGFKFDDILFVDTEEQPSNLVYTELPLKSSQTVLGKRPFYLIKLSAANFDNIGYTDEAIMSWLEEVNDFYKEQSYGKFEYTGVSNADGPADIIEVGTSGAIDCSSTFSKVTFLIEEAVKLAGTRIDYSTIPTVMVMYNPWPDSPCQAPTAAITSIMDVDGRKVYGALLNQDINQLYPYERIPFAVAHELGHTLGLKHSGIFNKNIFTTPVDDQTCRPIRGYGDFDQTDEEYSDHYDVMGSFGSHHFNAFNKNQLGWLDGTTMETVVNSGTYRLGPAEFPISATENDLRVLRIPRDSEGQEYIYVEYRTPYGFDENMPTPFIDDLSVQPTNVFDGALLHLEYPCPGYSNGDGMIFKPYSEKPGVDLTNPVLLPGDTFTDPKTGDSITVTAINKSEEGNYQDAWLEVNVNIARVPQILSPEENATVGRNFDFTTDIVGGTGNEEIEYYVTYYDDLLGTQEKLLVSTTARTIAIDTSEYAEGTPLVIRAQLKGTPLSSSRKFLIERCHTGDNCARAFFLYWKPMQEVTINTSQSADDPIVYRFSYWAKRGTTDTARIFIGNDYWSTNCSIENLTFSWQEKVCEFNAPVSPDGSSTTDVLVRILTGGGSDLADNMIYSYVDDLQLYLNGENPKDSVIVNGSFEQGTSGWWMGDDPSFNTLSVGTAPIHLCGNLDSVIWPAFSFSEPDIDIGDLTSLVSYQFRGGAAPFPLYTGDVNGTGNIDISDIVYMVAYQFKGGPKPFCAHATGATTGFNLGSNWTQEEFDAWYARQ